MHGGTDIERDEVHRREIERIPASHKKETDGKQQRDRMKGGKRRGVFSTKSEGLQQAASVNKSETVFIAAV